MSRQTNLRTMEKRIYDLEKNGGGAGGSVKWSDVTYKPFKTLDSNDFIVESDKLKLKNGGTGEVTKNITITNDTKICGFTNEKNIAHVLNLFATEDGVYIMGGWNITMSEDEPSANDVVEMEDTELNAYLDVLTFVTGVKDDTTLTASYADGVYDCKWESEDGYGNSYLHRPAFISENFNNMVQIESNFGTIYAVLV